MSACHRADAPERFKASPCSLTSSTARRLLVDMDGKCRSGFIDIFFLRKSIPAVAFLAGFEVPTHPGHVGCIVDNDPSIPVLMLTAADRATPLAARAVFARLFKTATAVYITSIWKLVALDRP